MKEHKFTRSVIAIVGLLSISSTGYAQGWRGIVPLHSTRKDVERLIGGPMQPGGMTYDLEEGRVNVTYSGRPRQNFGK